MGRNATHKFTVFHCSENVVNQRNIRDCFVVSGQEIRIKIVYLGSSKNEDHADIIYIIPQTLGFLKAEGFLCIFSNANFSLLNELPEN